MAIHSRCLFILSQLAGACFGCFKSAVREARAPTDAIGSVGPPLALHQVLKEAPRIMKLYFLRHAEAMDGLDDDARPLTSRGRKHAEQMGEFLRSVGVQFDAAYTSPLVRARQTAELVCARCGPEEKPGLVETTALRNEASHTDFNRFLKGLPDTNHVLLVGHAPTLAERARALIGLADPGGLELPKTGLVCVRTDDRRRGSLKLFVSPKSLGW